MLLDNLMKKVLVPNSTGPMKVFRQRSILVDHFSCYNLTNILFFEKFKLKNCWIGLPKLFCIFVVEIYFIPGKWTNLQSKVKIETKVFFSMTMLFTMSHHKICDVSHFKICKI
jgi:hypothetical protein